MDTYVRQRSLPSEKRSSLKELIFVYLEHNNNTFMCTENKRGTPFIAYHQGGRNLRGW